MKEVGYLERRRELITGYFRSQVKKRELQNIRKQRKLTSFDHIASKRDTCLEIVILQSVCYDARIRGKLKKNWSDDIKQWIALALEKIKRVTRDR